jgi:hypothetical protein
MKALSMNIVIGAMLLQPQLALSQKYSGERQGLNERNQILSSSATNFTSACVNSGFSFGYFNGVLTTYDAAQINKRYLERAYGTTASNVETIKYEVYYNYTKGFEDFVEVFDQRLNEQEEVLRGRFELFFEALEGGGSYLDQILGVISSLQQFKTAFDDYVKTKLVTILGELVARPPAITEYAEHKTRIDTQVLEGKKILLFAHSQGNLFANVAFDYASLAPITLMHSPY